MKLTQDQKKVLPFCEIFSFVIAIYSICIGSWIGTIICLAIFFGLLYTDVVDED